MRNFLKHIRLSLHGLYTESEIHTFGYLILEKVTGLSRTQLLVNKELELTDEQAETALQYTKRLKNHEPIQYILGETEFYGLKFYVNSAVLIPRPETEELVEWVEHSKDILDIGTGSGCIAIALKHKFPNARVAAMDVSEEALEVARKNAQLNRVEIEFIRDNILHPSDYQRKWDVIVSNPPYIPMAEKVEMDKHVTDFEPHLALFVENDNPLIFYKKIAEFAKKHLADNGLLYFETHRDLAGRVGELLEEQGFTDVEIRKDISGNERMVCGKWSSG